MRKFLSATLILFSIILLASCAGGNSQKNDREFSNVEVCMKVGVSPEGHVLPEVPEMSWKFYEGDEAKGKTTGILKMKVLYKATEKFKGDIQLLDLNNMPVTTEAISLDGAKDETETIAVDLHVSKDIAKRITKARIVLAPAF